MGRSRGVKADAAAHSIDRIKKGCKSHRTIEGKRRNAANTLRDIGSTRGLKSQEFLGDFSSKIIDDNPGFHFGSARTEPDSAAQEAAALVHPKEFAGHEPIIASGKNALVGCQSRRGDIFRDLLEKFVSHVGLQVRFESPEFLVASIHSQRVR